jgi:hypothetical protein
MGRLSRLLIALGGALFVVGMAFVFARHSGAWNTSDGFTGSRA